MENNDKIDFGQMMVENISRYQSDPEKYDQEKFERELNCSPFVPPGNVKKTPVEFVEDESDQEKTPPKSGPPQPPKVKSLDPSGMSAAQINRELGKLDEESSRITDEFIDTGRGTERPSDYMNKTDPLSLRARANWDKRRALLVEADLRYGPGFPGRLPRGFGPRKNIIPPSVKSLTRGFL